MPNNPRPLGPAGYMNAGVTILHMAVRAIAGTVTCYTRHSFGHRYFGSTEACGTLLMLFAGVSMTPPMLGNLWWPAFVVTGLMQLYHRSVATTKRTDRDAPHTHYGGDPHLARLGLNEDDVKTAYEPLACIFAGILVGFILYPSFGAWIALGGICIWADHAFYTHDRQERVEMMRDAMIEMAQLDEDLDLYDQF